MARQRWNSRLTFLFAAIGSAVGLGNVWRFPFLTYKFGGGAFLVPYLIALILIGIPTLILEFALGQKLQKGAVDAFKKINPKFRGIGFTGIFGGFVIVTYYAVIMAWALVFLVNSFKAQLPWANDANAYFFESVLHVTEGAHVLGGINWPIFIGLAVVWTAIYFSVFKGVDSLGKVVMIAVPLPILLLLVFLVRGLTLDGAMVGIMFYLKPNFSLLLNPEIWLAAATQIFFTLSVGSGIMIAYASYKDKKSDITKNAFITSFVNSGISLIAGFAVFSILGYMATSTGVTVPDVVQSGPGLAFVAFPEAISLMPFAPVIAVAFFIMLLTLGIDSAFSLVEATNTALSDKFKRISKAKISFVVCLFAFLFGIIFTTGAGIYFLDLFDHFVTSFILVIVGILQSLTVGWGYGAEKLRKYINSVSDWYLGKWWNYSIKYFIPIVLSILLVVQVVKDIITPYEGYPLWTILMGWSIVFFGVGVIVVSYFFKERSYSVKKKSLKTK